MAQAMKRQALRVYKTAKFKTAKRCEVIALINGVRFIACRFSAKTLFEVNAAASAYLRSPAGQAHVHRIFDEFPSTTKTAFYFVSMVMK